MTKNIFSFLVKKINNFLAIKILANQKELYICGMFEKKVNLFNLFINNIL